MIRHREKRRARRNIAERYSPWRSCAGTKAAWRGRSGDFRNAIPLGGIEEIIPLYASAYGDSGLTAQEVLEEILCDAMGQMNGLCHGGDGTGGR